MWNLLIREKPGPSLMTAASVNKGMCPSKSRSIPIDEICQMPRLRVRRLLEATRAGIPLLARVVCKGHHGWRSEWGNAEFSTSTECGHGGCQKKDRYIVCLVKERDNEGYERGSGSYEVKSEIGEMVLE